MWSEDQWEASKKKSHGNGTLHKQTHGHVDYLTNMTQRAELVKKIQNYKTVQNYVTQYFAAEGHKS